MDPNQNSSPSFQEGIDQTQYELESFCYQSAPDRQLDYTPEISQSVNNFYYGGYGAVTQERPQESELNAPINYHEAQLNVQEADLNIQNIPGSSEFYQTPGSSWNFVPTHEVSQINQDFLSSIPYFGYGNSYQSGLWGSSGSVETLSVHSLNPSLPSIFAYSEENLYPSHSQLNPAFIDYDNIEQDADSFAQTPFLSQLCDPIEVLSSDSELHLSKFQECSDPAQKKVIGSLNLPCIPAMPGHSALSSPEIIYISGTERVETTNVGHVALHSPDTKNHSLDTLSQPDLRSQSSTYDNNTLLEILLSDPAVKAATESHTQLHSINNTLLVGGSSQCSSPTQTSISYPTSVYDSSSIKQNSTATTRISSPSNASDNEDDAAFQSETSFGILFQANNGHNNAYAYNASLRWGESYPSRELLYSAHSSSSSETLSTLSSDSIKTDDCVLLDASYFQVLSPDTSSRDNSPEFSSEDHAAELMEEEFTRNTSLSEVEINLSPESSHRGGLLESEYTSRNLISLSPILEPYPDNYDAMSYPALSLIENDQNPNSLLGISNETNHASIEHFLVPNDLGLDVESLSETLAYSDQPDVPAHTPYDSALNNGGSLDNNRCSSKKRSWESVCTEIFRSQDCLAESAKKRTKTQFSDMMEVLGCSVGDWPPKNNYYYIRQTMDSVRDPIRLNKAIEPTFFHDGASNYLLSSRRNRI